MNIELAELINTLRSELLKAQATRKDNSVQFAIEEAELEVQVTATKEAAGKVGVQFWVYNAEGGGKLAHEKVHTLRLKLLPITISKDGKARKIAISDSIELADD